ncbi:TPA: hypothetical protein RQN07_000547 [Aeromonas dhakensis]|uniref:hypothetical protein n=1 Tax=Gammaproteobacteria TaxID=1236 RepID=UPI0018C4F2D0|nr:hypothetical protein [Vibrio cholerae]MBG2935160.1 hypothetical protein [Proteus mirabilis]HDX8391306.1 hypothetical protein [Aeromonas dhakensis]HEM8879969.1 hypothetical protein [Providencia stuartii]HDX8433855.1 hypothetical protein [Aeromonas dhakensis]
MAYHLHLNFENKEYFLSDGAWSTKETIQGLLLPIGAYQHADEKSAWNAVDELKSLVDEILDKVEIERNDWITQKPTIIYKEDVKLLIRKLKEEFYVNSYLSYLDNKKISEGHKQVARGEFFSQVIPCMRDEGGFAFD